MKAKVKETGQIIEIKDNCSIIDYARGIYTEKLSGRRFHDYELEFIYKENKNIDWELRRYEIARTVLHSFIGKKYYDRRSENYVEYTEGSSKKQIWIEDIDSLKAKVSLINENNLAGVASWQKGMETEEVWQMLKEELGL